MSNEPASPARRRRTITAEGNPSTTTPRGSPASAAVALPLEQGPLRVGVYSEDAAPMAGQGLAQVQGSSGLADATLDSLDHTDHVVEANTQKY